MCGRFTLRTPATVLIEHFDLDVRAGRQLELFPPRYNIAPTQEIAVLRADPAENRRAASLMRWGLIPAWSKDVAPGPPLINARAETLAEKPAFRAAFRARRCLIPADGFYEWQPPTAGGRGKKQPYYVHRPDGRPFAFAGLWERWKLPAGGTPIESCTIVTTAANATLRELHDRMPVVLAPCDYGLWLDPRVDEPAALAHLLAPCGDDELVAEPVTTHVNRVANDDPKCIEVERTLF
jgi:putative SOS response-associated peptidase YedK